MVYAVHVSVSVFVGVSITHRYSIKTTKLRIMQTMPLHSPEMPIKDLCEIRKGSPPMGATNAGGYVKIGKF